MAEGYYQLIGDVVVKIFGTLPIQILCHCFVLWVFSPAYSDVRQNNIKIEGLLKSYNQ